MVYRYSPTLQVRVGDTIKVPVTLWTPAGLTKIETIEWMQLVVSPRPIISFYKNIEIKDHMRICEFETFANWVTNPSKIIVNALKDNLPNKQLKLRSVLNSGCDMLFVKAFYEAISEGSIMMI